MEEENLLEFPDFYFRSKELIKSKKENKNIGKRKREDDSDAIEREKKRRKICSDSYYRTYKKGVVQNENFEESFKKLEDDINNKYDDFQECKEDYKNNSYKIKNIYKNIVDLIVQIAKAGNRKVVQCLNFNIVLKFYDIKMFLKEKDNDFIKAQKRKEIENTLEFVYVLENLKFEKNKGIINENEFKKRLILLNRDRRDSSQNPKDRKRRDVRLYRELRMKNVAFPSVELLEILIPLCDEVRCTSENEEKGKYEELCEEFKEMKKRKIADSGLFSNRFFNENPFSLYQGDKDDFCLLGGGYSGDIFDDFY